jgi:hypothetical protein
MPREEQPPVNRQMALSGEHAFDTFGDDVAQVLRRPFFLGDFFHDLPEPPHWQENFLLDPRMGRTIEVTRAAEVVRDAQGCFVRAGTITKCIHIKVFCEPFETVIIVQKESSGSISASASAGPGLGASLPNYDWKVVKYLVGAGYHYEFRVIIKFTTTICPLIPGTPPVPPQFAWEISKGTWVLATVNPKEICCPPPKVVAGPFSSLDMAFRVAASQRAPKVPDVLDAEPDLKLVDDVS